MNTLKVYCVQRRFRVAEAVSEWSAVTQYPGGKQMLFCFSIDDARHLRDSCKQDIRDFSATYSEYRIISVELPFVVAEGSLE